MKNILIIGITIFLWSNLAVASLRSCGEVGDPEYAAGIFLISAAQTYGVNVAKATCEAGYPDYCSPESQAKFGIEQIFNLMKNYPSAETSNGCASLRYECEKICRTSQVFSIEDCKINCN